MFKNLRFKWTLITFMVVAAVWVVTPLSKKVSLGLDLKGGTYVLLRADVSKLEPKQKEGATQRVIEIIRNRVDGLGVKEPTIQQQGADRVLVQLPGVTDREQALDIIGKTALLEFKLVSDDTSLLEKAKKGEVPAGYELKKDENDTPLLLKQEAVLTGATLTDATVQFDESNFGSPVVAITFNKEGADKFARITGDNVGRQLAILLDGTVRSAPRINERIPGGQAVISGRFSAPEASTLAIVLKAGSLPVPVIVEEDRSVGATLGEDSIRHGVRASIYGAVGVVVFLLIYYLVQGVIAGVAVALNLLLLLAGMVMISSSLTLPGIAGIALTLGMSVDANVLILERIREELAVGKSIQAAITAGYKRAFLTIFDSNLTTLITAVVLLWLGSGPVRGFAVTLSIGLVGSLFTSVFVTRAVYDFLLSQGLIKKFRMLKLIGVPKIRFIDWRWLMYCFSAALIVAGMAAFIMKGERNFGIDFTGGTLQQFQFERPISIDKVRSALAEVGMADATIQQFGESREIIIRTRSENAEVVPDRLKEAFKDNAFELLKTERVGPVAGSRLREQAIRAVLVSILAIAIYVAYRFEFRFSMGAALSLFHDVPVVLGALALTGREISLAVVAALLTVIGYSINDTIVVFDRVRENIRSGQMRKMDLKSLVNLSVNQTLSRTLLTGITTLFVLVSLYFFGGSVINDFAFTLLVGLVTGTYSSIYVASAVVVDWPGKKLR